MPKRSRSMERLLKKIKRLKKKIEERCEDESSSRSRSATPTPQPAALSPPATAPSPPAAALSPPPPVSHAPPLNIPEILEEVPISDDTTELDESILKILGDNKEKKQEWGDRIHNEIAERWENIIINGLEKVEKENILNQRIYLPPENCPHLQVPKLNPETAAACSDLNKKKDTYIEARQKMLSASIAGLAHAIQKVIKEVQPNEVKLQLLEVLNNTAKLLADVYFNENKTRRNLILSGLEKDIRDTLLETRPEKLLFGENLYEKIKTAKSVGKTGREIRIQPRTPKPTVVKNNQALNWKGPQRQTQRPQEPRVIKSRSSGPHRSAPQKKQTNNKTYRKQNSSSSHQNHRN